jgi:hypothetical protein
MSDTEITPLPPQDVFFPSPTGLTRWHAQFEHVHIVASAGSTVTLSARVGAAEVSLVLSKEHAEHLHRVLSGILSSFSA